jgi:phosphate-transporting ATPase
MLSVRDLTRPGLAPISFELADGECVAVVGASGSGKTLMLRAIADLDPNRGAVALDGVGRETMPAPEWRRRVVYVAAEPGWWEESVATRFEDWDRASHMIAATGLPDNCRDWPISRLSTGERQRLGLVRALVLEPRVLLLDEPTSGLDAAATRAVEELVHGHLARGACALWVTHDTDQSRRLASRRLVCADGAVSESAT